MVAEITVGRGSYILSEWSRRSVVASQWQFHLDTAERRL